MFSEWHFIDSEIFLVVSAARGVFSIQGGVNTRIHGWKSLEPLESRIL